MQDLTLIRLLHVELFPFANSYTAIYDHFDLLTSNTILAHCVHLEESEMDLIKLRNAGISHCPTYALDYTARLFRGVVLTYHYIVDRISI